MIGKINIITGATATGKTAYAITLANELNGIIINADSMQVYKEIPILTAQPSLDERNAAEHRLYGYISCNEHFSVGIWLEKAVSQIKDIISIGKTPILVGGTGMYLKSLIDGISSIPSISTETKKRVLEYNNLHKVLSKSDPETAALLKPNDSQRILRALEVFEETGFSLSEWKKKPITPFFPRNNFNLIHVTLDREILYEKINKRFIKMLEAGAIEEVENLYKKFGDINYPKANGIHEILSFLKGESSKDTMIAKTQQSSRNYAKRQLTFMRNQFDFNAII